MSEKIVSPGVFTNEIDQSFLPAAIADIGAALIGPTVKGPAGIPTTVTSFSDFQNKFGDVFKSGSNSYQFLTSHAAEQYLRHSNVLTVVRILDGTFSHATASIPSTGTTTGATFASGAFSFIENPDGAMDGDPDEFKIGDTSFVFVSSSAGLEDSSTQRFVEFGQGHLSASHATASAVANLVTAINAVTIAGVTSVSASRKGVTTNLNGVLSLTASAAGANNFAITTGSGAGTTSTTTNYVKQVANNLTSQISPGLAGFGGTDGLSLVGGTSSTTSTVSFQLNTLADGSIMNNADSTSRTNNILVSGSKHNLRYEISNVNNTKGTFTLSIRAGNDNHKRKQILNHYHKNLIIVDMVHHHRLF